MAAMNQPDDVTQGRCGICYKSDESQRSLHCGHAFCVTCLQTMCCKVINKICCPACDEVTRLGSSSVTELPSLLHFNTILSRLSSPRFRANLSRSSLVGTATPPLGEEEVKVALCDLCYQCAGARYCHTCRNKYCATCAAKHANVARFASHDVVAIETVALCRYHGEKSEEYCLSHDVAICAQCVIERHSTCDSDSLGAATERLKENLKSFVNSKAEMDKLSDNLEKHKNIQHEELTIVNTVFENIFTGLNKVKDHISQMKTNFQDAFDDGGDRLAQVSDALQARGDAMREAEEMLSLPDPELLRSGYKLLKLHAAGLPTEVTLKQTHLTGRWASAVEILENLKNSLDISFTNITINFSEDQPRQTTTRIKKNGGKTLETPPGEDLQPRANSSRPKTTAALLTYKGTTITLLNQLGTKSALLKLATPTVVIPPCTTTGLPANTTRRSAFDFLHQQTTSSGTTRAAGKLNTTEAASAELPVRDTEAGKSSVTKPARKVHDSECARPPPGVKKRNLPSVRPGAGNQSAYSADREQTSERSTKRARVSDVTTYTSHVPTDTSPSQTSDVRAKTPAVTAEASDVTTESSDVTPKASNVTANGSAAAVECVLFLETKAEIKTSFNVIAFCCNNSEKQVLVRVNCSRGPVQVYSYSGDLKQTFGSDISQLQHPSPEDAGICYNSARDLVVCAIVRKRKASLVFASASPSHASYVTKLKTTSYVTDIVYHVALSTQLCLTSAQTVLFVDVHGNVTRTMDAPVDSLSISVGLQDNSSKMCLMQKHGMMTLATLNENNNVTGSDVTESKSRSSKNKTQFRFQKNHINAENVVFGPQGHLLLANKVHNNVVSINLYSGNCKTIDIHKHQPCDPTAGKILEVGRLASDNINNNMILEVKQAQSTSKSSTHKLVVYDLKQDENRKK